MSSQDEEFSLSEPTLDTNMESQRGETELVTGAVDSPTTSKTWPTETSNATLGKIAV